MNSINGTQYRPLSPMESQFWLLDQCGEGAAYSVISTFSVKNLDLPRFIDACKKTLKKHKVFYNRYKLINGEPICFSGNSVLDVIKENKILPDDEDWFYDQCQKDFDLEHGPLAKLVVCHKKESKNIILSLIFHHIVMDLQTKDLIAKEICEYYTKNHVQNSDTTDEIENYYSGFVSHYKDWLTSKNAEKGKLFWESNLEGINTELKLYSKPESNHKGLLSNEIPFGENLSKKIHDYAKANTLSPFLIILSCYYLLLHRYSGEKNFAVALPLSNRRNEQFKSLVGCVVNTLPIKVDLDLNDTYQEYYKKIRQTVLQAHRHQEYPTHEIHRLQRGDIYHAGYTFEHPLALEIEGVDIEPIFIPNKLAQLPIFLRLWESSAGCFKGYLQLEQASYNKDFSNRFTSSLLKLLNSILDSNTSISLTNLGYLAETDINLIESVNNTAHPIDPDTTLVSLFEKQVEKTPDNIAVIFGNTKLTYNEFNNRVNQVARRLKGTGVSSGNAVAISLRRSLDRLLIIYAIHKCGAAYVPIDINQPDERKEYLVKQSSAAILITDNSASQKLRSSLQVIEVKNIIEQSKAQKESNLSLSINADSPAYIIYTSGSTGEPKGVINTHRGICNRLIWMQDALPLTENDKVLQKTPYSFDVSVWELFWALQTGASLAIAEANSHKNPYEILAQIKHYEISVIHFVPAMLSAFLSVKSTTATSLKTVICSGEELKQEHKNNFYAKYPDTFLYNLYGPTEAAVDVSFWQCDKSYMQNPLPIGKPVYNTKLYVVDEHLSPVPCGTKGELIISGTQVADGYIGKPELTERFFVDIPHLGGRCYRTGDSARLNNEGNFEFLGRTDFQVKLNGVRIELAEIENTLLQQEDIVNAVVKVASKGESVRFLQAYYETKSGKALDDSALKGWLTDKLPQYMIPKGYMHLTSLPSTSSGKIDRKKLPSPNLYAPPTLISGSITKEQKTVLSAWSKILGDSRFDFDSSFFDVGGDSLSLLKVFDILLSEYPKLKGTDMFLHPTIRSLAKKLDTLGSNNTNSKSKFTESKKRASAIRNLSSFKRSPRHSK